VIAGKIPGNAIIRMGVDPKCAQLNEGTRVLQQAVAATADGHLGNVFVHLRGTFPETPVPRDPIVIDQRKCIYSPRVVGMRVGQTLQIRNDDDLLHNVHASSARDNAFNIAQAKSGLVFSFAPKSEEVMVKLGCDVHRWMTAYVGVMTNPYFAVSAADGTFSIDKVPAGTYTIEAWHEQLGTVTRPVTVKSGAVTTAGLSYDIRN
jgi:plastocyanin